MNIVPHSGSGRSSYVLGSLSMRLCSLSFSPPHVSPMSSPYKSVVFSRHKIKVAYQKLTYISQLKLWRQTQQALWIPIPNIWDKLYSKKSNDSISLLPRDQEIGTSTLLLGIIPRVYNSNLTHVPMKTFSWNHGRVMDLK